MITIIAIGKKHELWIAPGLERYQKRLKAPWNVNWLLLPHSAFEATRARQEESERVLRRLTPTDFVIVLDERGQKINSPTLARSLESLHVQSKRIIIVIGGAYGVSDELLQRGNKVLSLSDMVFPHQLVRLLLIEQLYRAQAIADGTKYHHA
jgi:23S rRNA (pseudouridine1915-N3)-methyltransferase